MLGEGGSGDIVRVPMCLSILEQGVRGGGSGDIVKCKCLVLSEMNEVSLAFIYLQPNSLGE